MTFGHCQLLLVDGLLALLRIVREDGEQVAHGGGGDKGANYALAAFQLQSDNLEKDSC